MQFTWFPKMYFIKCDQEPFNRTIVLIMNTEYKHKMLALHVRDTEINLNLLYYLTTSISICE